MIWIFAAVVLFLAVVNPGFRKVVFSVGGIVLAGFVLLMLIASAQNATPTTVAPVAATEAPAVISEPVAAPAPVVVAVVKRHHIKPAARVAPSRCPVGQVYRPVVIDGIWLDSACQLPAS
jgi:TRAP-type C4-dicarboxylate transport system permease small subunit